MARTRRHHLIFLCIALLGVLLVPAGASAAGCDRRDMMDAAYANHQISTHSTACYDRVLAELPGDVDGYAPWVRGNLISAMRRDAEVATRSRGGPNARFLASAATAPGEPVAAIGARGPVTNLLEGVGPAHVDQVPTPVFALGGAAVLLLLAGLGTSLSRVRTRRLTR